MPRRIDDLIEQFSEYVSENWGERNDDSAKTPGRSRPMEAAPLTATLTKRRLLSRLKAFVRAESRAQAPWR